MQFSCVNLCAPVHSLALGVLTGMDRLLNMSIMWVYVCMKFSYTCSRVLEGIYVSLKRCLSVCSFQ